VIKLTSTSEQQKEASSKLTEQQALKALVYPLKVIVSPFKAFRDITQNPNFLGFLLIVGLFLLGAVSAEYVRASKIILDAGMQSTSLVNSNLFGTRLTFVLVQSAFSFLLNWMTYTSVLLLITRFFGGKSSLWRPFFIVIGYAFSVIVVYFAIEALLFSTLPEIHFEMSVWSSGTPEDILNINNKFSEIWGTTLAYQAERYISLAFQFWLVMLGAIALHTSIEIKWGKAIMISVLAYFTTVVITAILTSF